MRKGDRVRVKLRTDAQGSAVVVDDRVVTYLRGNTAAPRALQQLDPGKEGVVLATRAAADQRGGIAIVRFDEGVASVLKNHLELARARPPRRFSTLLRKTDRASEHYRREAFMQDVLEAEGIPFVGTDYEDD
jgi:hypothetical protein